MMTFFLTMGICTTLMSATGLILLCLEGEEE